MRKAALLPPSLNGVGDKLSEKALEEAVLRFVVLRHGVVPASRGGKLKTLVQAVAIGLFVLPLHNWPAASQVPDRSISSSARPWITVRWLAKSWAIVAAHYLAFGWWDTAQRESFFDWFVLVSLALFAMQVSK